MSVNGAACSQEVETRFFFFFCAGGQCLTAGQYFGSVTEHVVTVLAYPFPIRGAITFHNPSGSHSLRPSFC